MPVTLEGLKKELHRLGKLKKGWDSYSAPPPNSKSIKNGKKILDILLDLDSGLTPSRVVASVEGGIGIVFSRPTRYVMIECFNNGEIVLGGVGTKTKGSRPKAIGLIALDLSEESLLLKELRSFLRVRIS